MLLPLERMNIGSSIIASCYRILSGQSQLNARCLGILGVQLNRSTAGSIALSNRDYFPPRTHLRHRFLKCNIKHRLRLFLEFGHSYPRSANNEETKVIFERAQMDDFSPSDNFRRSTPVDAGTHCTGKWFWSWFRLGSTVLDEVLSRFIAWLNKSCWRILRETEPIWF